MNCTVHCTIHEVNENYEFEILLLEKKIWNRAIIVFFGTSTRYVYLLMIVGQKQLVLYCYISEGVCLFF